MGVPTGRFRLPRFPFGLRLLCTRVVYADDIMIMYASSVNLAAIDAAGAYPDDLDADGGVIPLLEVD